MPWETNLLSYACCVERGADIGETGGLAKVKNGTPGKQNSGNPYQRGQVDKEMVNIVSA
jgi:hypothetical protein